MHCLETIQRLNAEAAAQAAAKAPDGATHVVRVFTGLHLVKSLFANGQADLDKLQQENAPTSPDVRLEVVAL